jgi:CelD/BcsL family acetyltransferase involved in cellulose biosynthesis
VGKMQTKMITSTEEFYNLKVDWERLQDGDPEVTYYSTFGFVKTWWEVYKDEGNKELFIICVYDGNNVVGIAPLILEGKSRFQIKYKVLKFIAKGDYLGVLLDTHNNNEITIIKDIFKAIEKYADKFEKIQLTHIKHDSMLAYYLLRHEGYNKCFTYLVECPQIFIKKIINFEEYKKMYVSSSAKKYRNKLSREQNYKFRIIYNNKDDIYEKISELHIKEQKYLVEVKNRKDRSSLFENKVYSQFLKALYNENNNNIVTFVIIGDEDKLIIYDTCYFYKGILHSWNMAYDPEYEKYALGKVINYEIVNYIFESNIAEVFDFGTGRYPWKFQWTKDFIFDYQLDMWNIENKKARLLNKLSCMKKFFK